MRTRQLAVLATILGLTASWGHGGPLGLQSFQALGATRDAAGVNVGACCYHDDFGVPQCVVTTEVDCTQGLQGLYQGDFTNCNPSPCDLLRSGACCYDDGSGTGTLVCEVLYEQECEFLAGAYQGDFTTCNPDPCVQTGACCYRDQATGQWFCVEVSFDECETQYGGLYQGDGTDCGPPTPCQGVDPKGACCYEDAIGVIQCIVVSAYECDQLYFGTYQGDGTTCTPVDPCKDTGACCYMEQGTEYCVVTTPSDCTSIYMGTFLGTGTPCGPQGDCPGQDPEGACCYEQPPICTVVTQDECEMHFGGVYMGDGTTCSPNPCVDPQEGACCVLDDTGNSICITATLAECEQQLHGVFYGVGVPCDPDPCPNIPPECDCPGRCDNRTPSYDDQGFAPFTGSAAICTHYDWFVTGYSLVCVDIKDKNTAPLNTNWNATTLYSHPSWTLANLGTVFGVTADKDGHVYVTASTSFNGNVLGTGGWGTVYKIDAVSGLPSVFATLPNTGPGLGNICYDGVNDQLFVTNFEDGRIYRLDMSGTCLSSFDHATAVIGTCAPEAGDPPGFVALGERPWGIDVWNGRVYYGIWTEDTGRPSATAANTVWSVALSGGDFTGTPQLEITLPVLGTGYNYSNPPSAISFSENGCMLVSERSMYADSNPTAHQSRLREYRLVGTVWSPSAVTYDVGTLAGGNNSAGGADYDEDGDVWATGDALQFGPQVIYGLQGLPCTGGDVTDSILVDLNGNLSFQDKTQIGDVEVTCFAPRGACCFDGPAGLECAVMTEDDCEQLQGQYFGDGTDCDPDPCVETGACCHGSPVVCTVTTQFDCLDILLGTYLGDNTSCTPNPCPPEEDGACCVHDNAGNSFCVTATISECEQLLGGIFFGVGTPCTPDLCQDPSDDCDCAGQCDTPTPSYDDPNFAAFTGSAAVCTHHDPFVTGYSVVCVDLKNKGTAPINTNWNTTTLYSHPSWTLANLGTVFGVTVDNIGHTYVTATTSYYSDATGTGGWGTIYKINAFSGLPSVFATLPNSGPALGNIVYDGNNDQLFVTNFEDGRIYRLDMAGTCLSTFDHATGVIGTCAPEAGDPPGFATLGERPWGVHVWNGRVYYGLWTEDGGRPSTVAANEIWSIALAGGNFSGTPQLEITLPTLGSGYDYSNPPSDISFSKEGCMLISERTMYTDTNPSAHSSRVLEYRQIGTVWWPSPVTYGVGVLGLAANSAGGADYDEDGDVWATGDALQFGPQVIYGLQGLPCTGGNVTNSILVDLNGDVTFQDKTLIGDVEVTCSNRCALPPRKMVAWFPFDEPSGSTAYDIAWGNNGVYSGAATTAGMVQAARSFDGINDYVRVPNAAQLNFGTSNFSIDLWMRTTDSGGGVSVMVEKRSNPTRGYSLYLYNGQPGFQLADGAGFFNWNTTTNVADGAWHHIAVTVDRSSTTGVKFYIDGAFVQAYDPTPYSGNTTNASPLWIGVREPALGGGGYFEGDLDEIELFSQVLTPQAIASIYGAGPAGKCKERAYVPPVTSYCPQDTVKTVPFTIYNDSTNTYSHNWYMFGNTDCAVPGPPPSGFSPQNMAGVVIPGLSNLSWPIDITRPVGLVPPLTACYDGIVFNTTISHSFGTTGTLKAINWIWCLIILDPIDIDIVKVPFPGFRSVSFGATNTGAVEELLDYQIVARASDGGPDNVVSLDGLPPGEPLIRQISVPPGETAALTADVSYTDHEPFVFYDIILMVDPDGDGEFEPAEAIGVQSVATRPGDLNCDGFVDFGDINPFVQYLVDYAAWQAAFPDCPPENGDVDGDGDFPSFGDINPFVALLVG